MLGSDSMQHSIQIVCSKTPLLLGAQGYVVQHFGEDRCHQQGDV